MQEGLTHPTNEHSGERLVQLWDDHKDRSTRVARNLELEGNGKRITAVGIQIRVFLLPIGYAGHCTGTAYPTWSKGTWVRTPVAAEAFFSRLLLIFSRLVQPTLIFLSEQFYTNVDAVPFWVGPGRILPPGAEWPLSPLRRDQSINRTVLVLFFSFFSSASAGTLATTVSLSPLIVPPDVDYRAAFL